MKKLTDGQRNFLVMTSIIVILAIALGFSIGSKKKESTVTLTADQVKSLYQMTWSGSTEKLEEVVLVERDGKIEVKSDYATLR